MATNFLMPVKMHNDLVAAAFSRRGYDASECDAAARFCATQRLRRVAAKRPELLRALCFDFFQPDCAIPNFGKVARQVEVPFAINAIQTRRFLGQLI